MLRNVLRAIKEEGFIDTGTIARRTRVEVEDLEHALYLLTIKGYLKKSSSPDVSTHCAGCPLLSNCVHCRKTGVVYTLTEKGNNLLEK